MGRVAIYKFIRHFHSKRMWKKLRNENSSCPKQAVVFLGDSITERCDLKKYYPGIVAVNKGIHSESTDFLINRLDFSIYEIEPKVVVLLAGINDMIIDEKSSDAIAGSYERLLDGIRKKDPRIRIIAQSIYPTRDGTIFKINYLNSKINETNLKLKKLCDEKDCRYIP